MRNANKVVFIWVQQEIVKDPANVSLSRLAQSSFDVFLTFYHILMPFWKRWKIGTNTVSVPFSEEEFIFWTEEERHLTGTTTIWQICRQSTNNKINSSRYYIRNSFGQNRWHKRRNHWTNHNCQRRKAFIVCWACCNSAHEYRPRYWRSGPRMTGKQHEGITIKDDDSDVVPGELTKEYPIDAFSLSGNNNFPGQEMVNPGKKDIISDEGVSLVRKKRKNQT